MKEALSIKNRLISALLVLVMMFTSLIGTTFAWFTDEVTSSGNKIQSGNLQVDLSHLYKGEWLSLKENKDHKILNYDKWEPGYTLVDSLKVDNLGSLALKYRLSVEIEPGSAKDGKNGEKLSDVIEVYITYGDTAGDSYSAIKAESSGWTYKGTLTEVLSRPQDFITGQLLPTGGVVPTGAPAHTEVRTQVVKIALHMKESAGNEYQDLLVGDIYVSLLASQLDYENDSFGGGYDGGAEWPESPIGKNSIKAPIGALVDGKLAASMFMQSDDAKTSATFPEGVKADEGATEFVLTFDELAAGQANITLDENEEAIYLNVHVDGVAEDNEIPIAVYRKEVLPKGLNIGNYRLYHVEDGVTVQMTLRQNGATPVHNDFDYDPVTGDAIFYLKSFSEVALVAEPPKWEGNRDYSWYTNAVAPVAEGEPDYVIANADQLAAFGAIVGGMDGQTQDSFNGKTVKLVADINLGDKESENNPDIIFYPIGYWNNEGTYERLPAEDRVNAVSSGFYSFEGTFDGNGNTISNFYQNTWEMKGDHDWYDTVKEQYFRDGMGLFGKVYGGTVKNLTVENFSSDGEITTTGVIAAYADSADGKPATFENIAIINCNPRVYNIGNGGIVGCAGWYSRNESLGNNDYSNAVTFKNITVDQTNKISALWGTYDVSCGGILGQYYPDSGCGIKLENCHVAAIMDVNNDVCANYQYYWYRYSGMFIGTIRANTKDGGYTVADPTGITAKGCTYSYGSWNEYWYCELVNNSGASYTHDYQFGRLTNIDDISEIKSGETWLKEGNFALVSDDRKSVECYHIFRNSNGDLYRHFHDVADESNPEIYEDFDLNGDGELNDLKEDRQRYYLPFGQVFNGLGYGVKPTYTFDGFELVEDGTVISGTKFNVKNDADLTYRPGDKIYLKDLVDLSVDLSKLSQSSLYVAASPVNENETASITYSRDNENWENNYFVISNDTTGAIKLVITDYFYCTATVIYLNPEQASEKFTAKVVPEQDAYTQITLGTLFGVKDGATIGNVTATVTDPSGNATTVTGTSSDWTTKTVDLTNDGTWTVVIKDDDAYCAVTTVTFTVDKVDKFTKKFDKDFLYRVGNQNTVDVGTLFGEIGTTVNLSSVNVTIENVAGNAAGTFTPNATWTNGKIEFTGTGVVKVTISADGANAVELNLEVVDAKNVTSAESATSNNVVLLQDVSGGFTVYNGYTIYGNGFTVTLPTTVQSKYSAGYVGYITMNNGNLDNVKIDGPVYPQMNIYREQAVDSTDAEKVNYFYNSVYINGGNCSIINSYISGSRTAICIRGGNNVTIENTTVSGGAVANIEIAGASSVTLRNLKTDQVDQKDSYGQGSTSHGMGIYVTSGVCRIYVEGELNQRNWINQEQWEKLVGDYNQFFPKFFTDGGYKLYQKEIDGTTYVNLAMIFACNWDSNYFDYTKQTNSQIYEAKDGISLQGYTGGVYSVSGAVPSSDDLIKFDWVPTKYSPVAPSFEFDNVVNNDPDDEADSADTYCVYDNDNGILKIGVSGDSKLIDLSGVNVLKNGVKLPYTMYLNGTLIDGSSVTIKTGDGTRQTLIFKAIDSAGYDKYGNAIDGEVEYTWIITIEMATMSYPAPVWNMNGNYQFDTTNCYYAYYQTSQGYGEAVPIYEGVKINYYDKSGKLIECDLSGTDVLPTGSNNSNANAFTYTLTDGSVLTMKFSSGWKSGATTHQFTNYQNKIYIYPQSLDNDNYIRAKTTNQDFNVKITYCFTDPNGLSTGDVTMSWYNAKASNGSVSTVQWKTFDSINGKDSGCVTPDTLITLADGTQVRVDSLTGTEELLVWNLQTGTFDKAPILFNDVYDENNVEVMHLYFSDGTEVKVIYEHGFWDYDLNKYVYLDRDAAEYIGHTFAKQNGDALEQVQLVDVVIETEVTTAWSPVTAGHLCYFVNGMLSMPGGVGGLFNIFEVDPETMTYDFEAMQKDIETYGLYTYEELNALCPLSEEMFIAAGGAYLKVSIGKGNLTEEELFYMINRYSKYFN